MKVRKERLAFTSQLRLEIGQSHGFGIGQPGVIRKILLDAGDQFIGSGGDLRQSLGKLGFLLGVAFFVCLGEFGSDIDAQLIAGALRFFRVAHQCRQSRVGGGKPGRGPCDRLIGQIGIDQLDGAKHFRIQHGFLLRPDGDGSGRGQERQQLIRHDAGARDGAAR